MKCLLKLINKFLFQVLFFIIFCNSPSMLINGFITGKYPYVKRLNNGNYIIVSSTNITFTDPTLKKALKNFNFQSEQYENIDHITTVVTQFPAEDNGLILVIVLDILYIFSSTGNYLNSIKTTIEYTNTPSFIITNGHLNNIYNFTLIHSTGEIKEINSNIFIFGNQAYGYYGYFKFIAFNYDFSTNNINFIDEKVSQFLFDKLDNIIIDFKYYMKYSCNMLRNIKNETIVCAYFNLSNYINIIAFNPQGFQKYFDSPTIENEYLNWKKDHFNTSSINSILLPDEINSLLICYSYYNYSKVPTSNIHYYNPHYLIKCFNYNIETNQTSLERIIDSDINEINSFIIEYFYETNKIIIGFLKERYTFLFVEFSIDMINFTIYSYNTNDFFNNNNGDIGRINVVFPSGAIKYHIYYNPNLICYIFCSSVENVFQAIGPELDNLREYPKSEPYTSEACGSNYFYDYINKKCTEEIPDGFYINDTEKKTIERCHINCKTCKKGGTDINNNCESCDILGSKKFFDLGNCKENCEIGTFIDKEDYSIEKCKCSKNISCEKCTEKSIELNLCITCNKEEGFFPKNDELRREDGFINCYKNPEGYYLNKINEKYEPCYSTCNSCTELGNEKDNKCIKCKPGYDFKNVLEEAQNCFKICDYYYYFNKNNNKYYCTEKNNCPKEYNKLISKKKMCIDDCKKDDIYIYYSEYDNNCHKNCPKDTIPNDDNICIFKKMEYCSEEFPYLDLETNECVQNCSVSNLFNKNCLIDNPDKEIKQIIYNKINNEIISRNLDTLLDNVLKNEENLLIEDKDIKYQITSTKIQNQKNIEDKNISTINLGDCEKILKNYYNINENNSLIILKIDYYIKGLLYPFVMYDIYHPITKEKLDLVHCQDVNINITLPLPDQINEKNIFKSDPENNFYKDICYAYTTENGTDITINDRKNEFIDKNLSLCEDNCDYNGFDTRTKKIICNCIIKIKIPHFSDIEVDKEKLKKKFIDIKTIINLELMKCFNALFSKDGLKTNVGNYVLLSIIFIYFLFYNLFYLIEYDQIINKISEIIGIKVKNEEKDNNMKNKINDSSLKKKNDSKIKIAKKNKAQKNKKEKTSKTSSKLNLKEPSGVNKSNVIYNNTTFTLGNIDDRNVNSINKIIIPLNDFELNSLKFDEALKFDNRTFCQYYLSLLRTKHLLFFAYIPSNDYNSSILKKCIFLFSFTLYYAINALFITDSTIHEIYEEKGKYNFLYQLPGVIYSSIISSLVNIIIRFLSLSEKDVIIFKNLKSNNEIFLSNEKIKLMKLLRIKFVWFFNLSLTLLFLFWYYISCFCAVYKNTQFHLLKDTFISSGISLIYPIFIYLLPGIFRVYSLKKKISFIYKISKIAQML